MKDIPWMKAKLIILKSKKLYEDLSDHRMRERGGGGGRE